jgi:RNA polymerase sigma factor (sigma-70 family)
MTPLLAQRPRSDRGFERLYRRYVGDVYRYALAVMRNPADAEDVTQTTFLNAYRAYVEKGERPQKPQNWLIAITHNVCRQRFRQSARRPSEVEYDDDIADTIVEDETPSGEDIRRALSHLAFNQRAAIVMRELEGRSYAEIAEILDVSTSAVETLIFRARRALREQLEGSLSCGQAELAISRQLDGRLTRAEKGQLRAHLRECAECAGFARRQRAQRSALKSFALIPVPSSLGSFFGSGAAVGTGLAAKAAAALTAGLVIGGGTYEGVRHSPWLGDDRAAATASGHERAAVSASNAILAASPEDTAHPPRSAPATAKRSKPGRAAVGARTKKQTKAHNAKNSKATTHGEVRGHAKSSNGRPSVTPRRHVKAKKTPVRTRPAPVAKSHRGASNRPKLPRPVKAKPETSKKPK